jgi:hypothetical protein
MAGKKKAATLKLGPTEVPLGTRILFSDYADDWRPEDAELRELVVRRVQKLVDRLLPIVALGPLPKDVLRRVYELSDEGNLILDMLHDGWLVERGHKKSRSRKYGSP